MWSRCSVMDVITPICLPITIKEMRDLQEELRTIRKQLRLSMNGVTSTSMREKGVTYKLNFGVSYPEIKEIALQHEPDAELAEALWAEDVREFKILATLLRPADSFSKEEAMRWVREIPYLEIAEHCARNLFARLPYREQLALELVGDATDRFARTVAFLLWTALFKQGERLQASHASLFLDAAMRVVAEPGSDTRLGERLAAVQALKYYGRGSEEAARQVLDRFEPLLAAADESAETQEIYNELKFEFEYYR